MIEGHTSRAFDGALAALHMRVVEMGGLVLDQVREAAVAYSDWDSHSAEHVMVIRTGHSSPSCSGVYRKRSHPPAVLRTCSHIALEIDKWDALPRVQGGKARPENY